MARVRSGDVYIGKTSLLFLIAHQVGKNGRPKAKFSGTSRSDGRLPPWEQTRFLIGAGQRAPDKGPNLGCNLAFSYIEAFSRQDFKRTIDFFRHDSLKLGEPTQSPPNLPNAHRLSKNERIDRRKFCLRKIYIAGDLVFAAALA